MNHEIFVLEEELETPNAGDGFNLVLQSVRAEARRTRNLIRRIMSDVQQHLDTDIAGLADVLNQLEAEVTSLKSAAAPEVDFSKADALLASAKAFVAPPAPPAATTDPSTAGAATTADAAQAPPPATAGASADAVAGSSTGSAPAVDAPAPLTGPAEIPAGSVGAGYSATLVATGGTAPYSFTVEGLPAGLTASGGAISGTPQTAGSSTLTVTVTDSTGATAQSQPVLTVS